MEEPRDDYWSAAITGEAADSSFDYEVQTAGSSLYRPEEGHEARRLRVPPAGRTVVHWSGLRIADRDCL